MSQQDSEQEPQVTVIGPEGPQQQDAEAAEGDERDLVSLVEQPAKVMRIGGMVRHLLEEVKSAPVDDAGRKRLAGILHQSVTELKEGLAPELDAELDRLIEPFDSETPSESELRIAQAQLVGWLEGLFHGIQTAIYAQQMAARAQLEQMRHALPPGVTPDMVHAQMAQAQQGQQPGPPNPGDGHSGGMYL